MTGIDRKDLESLPLPLALHLDKTCGRFESAWQALGASDTRPRIEDYLADALGQSLLTLYDEPDGTAIDESAPADVVDQLRHALMRELVLIDLTYRHRAGEAPGLEKYLERFPGLDRDGLASALATLRADEPPTHATPGPQGESTPFGAAPTRSEELPWAATPPLRLPVQFDDYELLEEIARGGMGVVYRARQLSLNRIVALKMILEGGRRTGEAVQRFYREAQAAAALDHPHIVAIHACGQHEGHPFFAMAYVEGDNLREVVRQHGLPTPHQAVGLLCAVAEAVHHAHQHGILHRDLKPENVLLDRQGRPRVTDFGLACQLDAHASPDRLTRTGQLVGTPSYMSPEQAMGKDEAPGPAADVYSLGGILYYLLTEQPPFQGRSMTEVLCRVMAQPPMPPREINPQAHAGLEAVCLRCLEKEPAKRYPSAQALAEALRAAVPPTDAQNEQWLVGVPPAGGSDRLKPELQQEVGVPPAGGEHRLKPGLQPDQGWSRRRRLALAAVALVVLAVGVWLTSALWWPGPTPPKDKGRAELPPPPAPPEKLHKDFPLEVAMVGKRGGDDLVKLEPGKDGIIRLRVDEEVKFRVKVARAAYVGIWSIEADGTIVQLFPNHGEKDHYFKQDEERVVPTTKAQAVASIGLDWVWVQASTKPWIRDPGRWENGFLVCRTAQEHSQWAEERGIRLRPDLSEAVLRYRVEPK